MIAGVINNTAIGSGTPPIGPEVSDPDDESVPVVEAEFTVTKTSAVTLVTTTVVENTASLSSGNAASVNSGTTSNTIVIATEITYTITVTNIGDGNAVSVILFDVLPASLDGSLSVTSISDGGTLVGNQVEWNLGAVNAGDAPIVRSFTVRIIQ